MTYEEYLKRYPSVYGMPNSNNTMTIPSTENYRKEQWGASLSNEDLRKLMQAGIDNSFSQPFLPNQPSDKNVGLMERIAGVNSMGYSTSEVNPVFDPNNPLVSETNTKKDNDGNSITTTIKGKYEDAVDAVSDTFDTGVNYLQSGYNKVNDSIDAGYDRTEEYIQALNDRRLGIVNTINQTGSDLFNKGSEVFDDLTFNPLMNYEQAVSDLPTSNQELAELWSNYGEPLVDKALHGTSIDADQDGSEQKIAEAYAQLGDARTIAEEELGLNWEVPGNSDVIDAQPNVVAAQEFLTEQINAKEKFLTEDVVSVDKILGGITDSETWSNLEKIASSIEQSGYKIGDDYTKWAAENPFTAAATLWYGGPIAGKIAMAPIRLAKYMAKKAPWVLKKLKWFATPGGFLVTGAGIEQYFKNEEEIDAWIGENVPEIIHSPIETIANALTNENVSDEDITEKLGVFELSNLDPESSDEKLEAQTSTGDVTGDVTGDEGKGDEGKKDEEKTEESILDSYEPILLETKAKELIETTGANENLDPTVDEAAKVLAETPELIDRMNSLADYMDSTTNEEALAAARQAAIDIENDSSHSDRTSAAAMTFLASMLFGGSLTDSFNAAFRPIGKYYDAKRAAEVKRTDEAAAEATRIRLEKRAADRADEVYAKTLADERTDAAVLAAANVAKTNAELQNEAAMFNIQERNDLLIAGAKEETAVTKALITAIEKENKRIIQARKDLIQLVTSDVHDDFKELLSKKGKMSIGRQVTSAINEIEKVVSKSLDANGKPRVFDLDEPANRTAVYTAVTNYVNDVTAGIDGNRTLTTYMTDMIVKRELEQYQKDVIKPQWFTVPVRDEVSTYMPKDADPKDYTYKKLKKRDNINTEKKFAETNKQVYDIIQNVAFDKGTATGNPIGMERSTKYFVKDFQDMQNNYSADFDRLVRNAVKYGVHPFSYFVLRYNPKWKIGQQFEK